jgi:hypothetical protein
MRWITRARPRIDRIACPWLITRFIDPVAEFFFVPAEQVKDRARELGAIPFDVEGVELSHVGPLCGFDALLHKYGLEDPALREVAVIAQGMVLYDALYAWARHVRDERHTWNPQRGPAPAAV